MTREVRQLDKREHYAADYMLVLRQRWDEKETTLGVRRVVHENGTEELQLEITVRTFHKKRTTEAHSSVGLPPDLADKLAEACRKVVLRNREIVA